MKKQDIHHEGEFFIGARLAAKRAKLGIPIEKAAKDNRLSLERLRALETDDFSGFAHPTYARLFLLDYATYLRVPHEEIRGYLPGSKGLGHDDNNYLEVLIANNGFLKGEQFKSARRMMFAGGAAITILLSSWLASTLGGRGKNSNGSSLPFVPLRQPSRHPCVPLRHPLRRRCQRPLQLRLHFA